MKARNLGSGTCPIWEPILDANPVSPVSTNRRQPLLRAVRDLRSERVWEVATGSWMQSGTVGLQELLFLAPIGAEVSSYTLKRMCCVQQTSTPSQIIRDIDPVEDRLILLCLAVSEKETPYSAEVVEVIQCCDEDLEPGTLLKAVVASYTVSYQGDAVSAKSAAFRPRLLEVYGGRELATNAGESRRSTDRGALLGELGQLSTKLAAARAKHSWNWTRLTISQREIYRNADDTFGRHYRCVLSRFASVDAARNGWERNV